MANSMTQDDEDESVIAAPSPTAPSAPDSNRSDRDSDDTNNNFWNTFGAINISENVALQTGFGTTPQPNGRPAPIDTSAIVLRSYDGKFHADTATTFFQNHFPGCTSQEICAKAVREGLQAAGVDMTGHPVDAYQYADFLPKRGFEAVAGGQGGRFDNSHGAYKGVAGDIVVINPHNGAPGHIAMLGTDGKWHSDFVHGASGMLGGQMFYNQNVTFQVFRHQSLINAADAQLDQRIDLGGQQHAEATPGQTTVTTQAAPQGGSWFMMKIENSLGLHTASGPEPKVNLSHPDDKPAPQPVKPAIPGQAGPVIAAHS